jgi:hypothetical protein
MAEQPQSRRVPPGVPQNATKVARAVATRASVLPVLGLLGSGCLPIVGCLLFFGLILVTVMGMLILACDTFLGRALIRIAGWTSGTSDFAVCDIFGT